MVARYRARCASAGRGQAASSRLPRRSRRSMRSESRGAGSMLQVTVPVRRRMHHQPIYHLVFLTRSTYGLWVFADALGRRGRHGCVRALLDEEDDCPGMLVHASSRYGVADRSEKTRATGHHQANLRGLVHSVGRFQAGRPRPGLYGEAYGVATDATVTAAVQALKTSGELVVRPERSRLRERVVGLADLTRGWRGAGPASDPSMRPSSSRPPAFGVRPPHCLKKNGTSAPTQRSRIR